MYFKEKEDTNIDSEFENKKSFGLNFKKINPKLVLFIAGGLILLLVIIFIATSLISNSSKYTIELTGGERITINLGGEYVEPGYKAYDNKGNDVTESVEITSTVNTSKKGEYEVLYSVGKTNKVRYVVVEETLDETYIYLKGDLNMYLEVGEKYNEPGFEVYDSIGQDLTDKVKVDNPVDTSKVGTYTITYSVVNSRNVTTTVKRTIHVVAKK